MICGRQNDDGAWDSGTEVIVGSGWNGVGVMYTQTQDTGKAKFVLSSYKFSGRTL